MLFSVVEAKTMARLTHLGLHYQDERDLLAHSVPFVRQGVDLGEPVLIALPAPWLEQFRERFGTDPGLTYVDIRDAGRNPGRILPWIFHSFAQRHPERKLRILGEPIWPGRSEAAYPACLHHEALVNLALSDVDLTLMCTYDSSALSEKALSDSYYTHPLLLDGHSEPQPSPHYAEAELARHYFLPLPPPPAGSTRLAFGIDELHTVRELVAAQAESLGIAPERAANLQLAATEAATNAILHGGGAGLLFVWDEDDSVVCEFQSNLPMPPPLAGSRQVPSTAPNGRGLTIINHLCDLVRWHASEDRCALRFWFGSGRADLHQMAQPSLG
jgi:anti-sigma regulatory factor (Ser/Thr protein kinase)